MRSNFLTRIYRLKLLVLGLTFLILSILLSLTADWLSSTDAPHQLTAVINALSDVLLVTGAIGLAVDFFTGRDKDAADTERTRTVLKELTPDFTEAVLKGLAVDKSDLERIASPELLDDIATNALSLRLGDDQFAREIYTDVRDQAIRAPERWYDVDVNIRLSSIDERSTYGAPRFDVLVKWEYTVVPSHPVQRFACFSDRDELHDVVAGTPGTIPWLLPDRPGVDATARDFFDVLEYRIDGEPQNIRRSVRKRGQVFTVTLGEELVKAGKPLRISYVFKTISPKDGHRLYLELTQPTHGLSLKLDHTDTDIARMSVTDLVTSAALPIVAEMPKQAEAKIIAIDLPGWLLPRAGFAFVWTLLSEQQTPPEGHATSPRELDQDAA